MSVSLFTALVLTSVGCTLTLRIDKTKDNHLSLLNFERLRLEPYLKNEVYLPSESILKQSTVKEDDGACKDFYSYTCNKTKPEALRAFNFKENLRKEYDLFYSFFIEKFLENEIESNLKPLNIERQMYDNCMNLGNDDYESEDYKNKLNADGYPARMLSSKFHENIGKANTWQELDEKLASLGFGHSFFDIDVIRDPLNPKKNIIVLQPPSIKELNFKKLTDFMSDILLYKQLDKFESCKNKESENEKSSSNEQNSEDKNSQEQSADESNFKEENSEKEKSEDQSKNDDFLEGKNVEKNKYDNISYKEKTIYQIALDSSDEDDSEPVFIESLESTNDKDSYDSSTSDEANSSCKIFEDKEEKDIMDSFVNDEDTETIEFYNDLLKAIFDPIDVTKKKPIHFKTTIQKWNTTYNNLSKSSTINIDWPKIIKAEFKRFNININDDEPIIIRNKPYFLKLPFILKINSNDLLMSAIQIKFYAENARYFDWKWADSINSIDKSTFCLADTKLYVVSEAAMEDYKKLLNMEPHLMKAKQILHNVIKVLHSNISEERDLSETRKAFLHAELRAITNHVFGKSNNNHVMHFYDNFELTGDYSLDILSYRNMLKNKTFHRLRDDFSLSYEYLPFSINDVEIPRNRFILHAILGINAIESIFSTSQEKEVYYATYGVNIAGFLYSLMKEDIFETDMYYRHGSEWLIPHVSYSPQAVNCVVPKDVVAYGYKLAYATITEMISVRLAYEALLHESSSNSTKKFFDAYVQTHCGISDKKKIVKVVSSFNELSTALSCPNKANKYSYCKLMSFNQPRII